MLVFKQSFTFLKRAVPLNDHFDTKRRHDIQHTENLHKGLICDTRHNVTQY
jgi:hypothetical protein